MNAAVDHITLEKKELRRRVLAKAEALDRTYSREADAAIRSNLLSLPEYRRAKTVFCFVGTGREIDTSPFLEQVLLEGKSLCVPLCVGRHIMEARLISSLSQLRKGYFGLLEPDPESSPLAAPEDIDLAVIPCVTCSRDGARLGYGGGFYDTFFTKSPGIPAVMICREQVMEKDIPREAHDLIFPTVVTEKGVFCSGTRPTSLRSRLRM